MPFCRECGKEINNEWVWCPFCSVSLQIDTPPHSNNYEGPQGTPSPDWKDVLHNGQLIELVPSDDWEYYWANDEWHSINQPIPEVPSSNPKTMPSNTMAPPSGFTPSSFHPKREMTPRSSPKRVANINYEMFEEDDDEEDEKKLRNVIVELLKFFLFDLPMGYFGTEAMKNGEPMLGLFILLGTPLIHIGPNASKKVKVASAIVLTIIVMMVLSGILYVWADSLVAQDAAEEGTFVWQVSVLGNSSGDIDDLVYVQMYDGNGLNWDDLIVTISINGDTSMRCAADNSTNACSYNYYQNSSGNDAEWETGEGIVITEGNAGDCDGTDNCNVDVILVMHFVASDDVIIGEFAVTVN